MILGFLSVIGIILLFFRTRPEIQNKVQRPASPEKLFAQVILAGQPKLLKLWEEGDRFIKKEGLKCKKEEDRLKIIKNSLQESKITTNDEPHERLVNNQE